MSAPPKLLPTGAAGETYAGLTYHIQGELVPVLHVDLAGPSPSTSSTTSCCGKTRPSPSG